MTGVVLVLSWSGCGGSGEPDVQSPTPIEERAARAAEAQVQREAREQRQVEAKIRAEEQQRRKEASRPLPEPEPVPEPGSASGGFTGPQAKRYAEDREICGLFPPSKVARDLGLPANSDSVTIAEAYADGYQPQFRQAAFEGCLDGLGS